jgi:hypothetical protein
MASPDFPQEIYIFCNQLSGYSDNFGEPTNIIAIFRICQFFQTQVGGVMTYTVGYSIKDTLSWPLGLTRTLSFSIGDINGVYPLPLTSPVNV